MTEPAEPTSDADHAELLAASNDKRVEALEEIAGQPGSLKNAFDALRILTFLEQVAVALDVRDQCELVFQSRREEMIAEIEETYAKMRDARDAAERAARLSGGPVGRRAGVPQRPGPGGRLITP